MKIIIPKKFKVDWVPYKNINYKRVNDLLQKSIETGRFSNGGPNVQLLEQVIRKKLQIDDTKTVVVVTNGSVALHALSSSIEYFHKQKINWATQSFTFPPSAQGTLSNAKIVDIDKDGCLNLEELDETINGIIVTNIFGNIVDIDKYENWAKENDKFLIFDNAATPFTFYKGKSCCNYGHGCTISFHHTKPFGFGEGGAIIVDKKYEKNIRCLNNFGINLTDNYWVREGNNHKMSDISAVYIIQYLDNFDNIVKKHQELYRYFKTQIIKLNLPIKLFPSFHDDDKIMASCCCLLFDKYDDNIRLKLLENDIFCRKYYHPLLETKNTVEIFNKILCLPCTVDMTKKNIDFIINIIKSCKL
jgi:dTDP-4-amino-4,6-dideoxygalactose transaminase